MGATDGLIEKQRVLEILFNSRLQYSRPGPYMAGYNKALDEVADCIRAMMPAAVQEGNHERHNEYETVKIVTDAIITEPQPGLRALRNEDGSFILHGICVAAELHDRPIGSPVRVTFEFPEPKSLGGEEKP